MLQKQDLNSSFRESPFPPSENDFERSFGQTADTSHEDKIAQGKSVRKIRRHRFSSEIRKELSALCQPNGNSPAVIAILEDFAIISVAIAIALAWPIMYPLTLLFIGTRCRAFATILHESAHYTLCKSRRLNRVLGMLSGWAIFQTFYAYRMSHVQEHHPYLGDADRDPDLINYENQNLFDSDAKTLIWKHFVPLLIGLKTWINFRNLVKDRLLPKDLSAMPTTATYEYFGFVAFWLAIISVATYFDILWELFIFWFVPYFTVFQATNWIIELAEHFPLVRLYGCELHMTRNRRGPWIERVFTGMHGENWHLVHHMNPGIPFWKLEEAHTIMMKDPAYAKANMNSGGLFFPGPDGEPSILSLLSQQLTEAQKLRQV